MASQRLFRPPRLQSKRAMKDWVAGRIQRDRLAAVGIAPLVLVLAYNLAALGANSIYVSKTFSEWMVPAAFAGLGLAGVLVRDAWRLAAGKPPSPSLRRVHWQILGLACGLVAAALWVSLCTEAGRAEAQESRLLVMTSLALLAVAVILVMAGAASVRPRTSHLFKLGEAAVILVAHVVVFGAIPAFMWLDVSAMRRTLRVETSSQDPFIVALCHGDHDKAASLLPSVGEQAAREAPSCIPDNYVRYKREPGVGEYEAGMRLTLIIEAVQQNDPLTTGRTRGDGPCTVAETNLLRRLERVAPNEVRYLSIDRLPTNCPGAEPVGASAASSGR